MRIVCMLLEDRLGILASDRYTRCMGAVSVTDLLIIYLVPVALLAAFCLAVPLVVYVLMRTGRDFDFRHDVLQRFEAKRALRSGQGMRLTYGYVLRLMLGDNCVQAAFFYRVARWLVAHRLGTLAEVLHAFSKMVTHLDVSPGSHIAPGVYFYHGLGIVIGKGSVVGRRALICQGVTMGGGARIGDDVRLWAGAKVIGRISVGDRSEVGANAVVV